MNEKVPWYAAIVLVILKLIAAYNPTIATTVQELVSFLTILWFGHAAASLETLRKAHNGGE